MLNAECLGFLCFSLFSCGWYQVDVSVPLAESSPKNYTLPGFHTPCAVAGVKESTALPACGEKDDNQTVAPESSLG